jgi:hypothetical protein
MCDFFFGTRDDSYFTSKPQILFFNLFIKNALIFSLNAHLQFEGS